MDMGSTMTQILQLTDTQNSAAKVSQSYMKTRGSECTQTNVLPSRIPRIQRLWAVKGLSGHVDGDKRRYNCYVTAAKKIMVLSKDCDGIW